MITDFDDISGLANYVSFQFHKTLYLGAYGLILGGMHEEMKAQTKI